MTSLSQIQRSVRDAVFEAGRDGPALRAASQHVLPGAGMTSTEHLTIYKGAILGTLERALGNIYPVCERLLGQEFFAGMARQFAYETPSTSPDLANFGDGFDTFIADFEPAAALTYLPDIAKLEWHWHRAFNAGDETVLRIPPIESQVAVMRSGVVAAATEGSLPSDWKLELNAVTPKFESTAHSRQSKL